MIILVIALAVLALVAITISSFLAIGEKTQKDQETEVKRQIADGIRKAIQETEKELDALTEEIADLKDGKIVEGSSFNSDVTCKVVKLFYHQDKHFAIYCPLIGNRYIDFPGILEIDNRKEFLWDKASDVDTGAVEVGIELYKDFKAKNKTKFNKGFQ